MNDFKVYLKNVKVAGYQSLGNVQFPLKPLTILVGPNASGKSNTLDALELLRTMMVREDIPAAEIIENLKWAGGSAQMSFQLDTMIDHKQVCYSITLQPNPQNRVLQETLTVDGIEVISIRGGKGTVKDEDGRNSIEYRANKLALKSAGDYGDKPITNALRDFIRDWEFFEFDPSQIRRGKTLVTVADQIRDRPLPNKIDDDGFTLYFVLSELYENSPETLNTIRGDFAKAFRSNTQLSVTREEDGTKAELGLIEGYTNPIPLENSSDGTLRLLAYQVLLRQPELPSLIGIEEPEQSFHPAWLNTLSEILKQLSRRTQVVVTTHSSQLLDKFDPHDLDDNLGVLLLWNEPGQGTQIITLDEARKNKVALQSWIEEFGIGSAIFESDLLENPIVSPS